MKESSLLEIQDLTVSFASEQGSVQAVKQVSFCVDKGETVAVVGESGSGKSVTSLAIMGLIPNLSGNKMSGSIRYQSETEVDLLQCSEKQFQQIRGNQIAMIFQEPMTSLNPVHTCGKQVVEAIRQHQKISRSVARKEAIRLFEEVLLPRPETIFSSYPHQLSGGQKQRVMIAMAMSCKPRLLIADEPTTALDVTVQKTILELIGSLQQKYQMAVLFITHDLGVVADIADRVLVMYRGEMVEQGPASLVLQSPAHPYTKGLLACRPPLDFRPRRLATIADYMQPAFSADDEQSSVAFTPNADCKDEPQPGLEKKPILQVKGLKKAYITKKTWKQPSREVRAVDALTFDVFAGETLGLVGESGCGKTTLGRTLLRLIAADGGEVWFMGHSLLNLSDRAFRKMRKEMQIVFQDPYSSLNPRICIGQAIQEPMKVHHIGENRAERQEMTMQLLEKVGLNRDQYHRYPHEFSGGQRQRICIARALALQPRFIVCDESVSALDVSIQAQVLNLLNDLKKEFGFTYIFISHDLSVVRYMSDRMIVMKQGRIEELGDADALYTHPQSEYTRRLIESIPGR